MTIRIEPRDNWKPFPGSLTGVTVLSRIASEVERSIRCADSSPDNARDAADSADEFVREFLPRGAGFDNGTAIDWERSKPNRIVFETAFHHMDEFGGYDGWTDHRVTIVPDFVHDYDMKINGRDRNEIKDYIADTFRSCLDDRISLVPDELQPGAYVWSSDWSRAEKLRRDRADFVKRLAGMENLDPYYWQPAQRKACERAIVQHMHQHNRMVLADGHTAVQRYSGCYVIEYPDGVEQDGCTYRSMAALLFAVDLNRA